MNSYPFINDLFKTVLEQSRTIQGRFFISAKQGRELNSDTLGDVLTELNTNYTLVKYPLALMLAPVMTGDFAATDEWNTLRVTILFLRTTYIDGYNNTEAINENTQTSTRAVINDWHDMALSAQMFVRVLNLIQRKPGNNNFFRIEKGDKTITPVSYLSNDRASGVRLDFNISLFVGCELEDYTDISLTLNNITFSYQTPYAMPVEEIITYTSDEQVVYVSWTDERRKKFGSGTFEVYYLANVMIGFNGGGDELFELQYVRNNAATVRTDALPPNQTGYFIITQTLGAGYIKITP